MGNQTDLVSNQNISDRAKNLKDSGDTHDLINSLKKLYKFFKKTSIL
jgi:hypothetical protein